MNIFKILASNDGTINEPNISSFLAYLLDYKEDHGLSDSLLKLIIEDFQYKNPNYFKKLNLSALKQYRIKVNPEHSVYLGDNKHRDIDIVIELFDNSTDERLYSICIENKISDKSINKKDNQLSEELEGLQREYSVDKSETEIYFCFITLKDTPIANKEFNKLNYDKKIHIYWQGKKSIQEKLLKILHNESIGDIDPIQDNTKFLLKSFIAFIKTDFKSFLEEKIEREQKANYGKPTREHFKDFLKKNSEKYSPNKIIKKKELMQDFTQYIKDVCNKDINKNQLACLMYEITANEKNRIYYNVNQDNYKSKNILFYPNEEDKKYVQLYSSKTKVKQYYLAKGEKTPSCTDD